MTEEITLSKDTTTALKGIFSICVLIHHMYQVGELFRGSFLGAICQMLGYLSVAMFFFMSGYGLMTKSSDCKYIDNFLKHRLLPFFVDYIFFILLYFIYDIFIKKGVDATNLIRSFLPVGDTIVKNGWYMKTSILLYLIFYVVFKLCSNNRKRIIYIGVAIIAYIVGCYAMKYNTTIYESVGAFFLGMVFQQHKKNFLRNNTTYFCALWINLIFFISSFFLHKVTDIESLSILFKMLSAMAFAMTTILISMKVNVNMKYINFLGKISMEIYLLQGMVLSSLLGVNNKVLFCFLTILLTILLACVIHPIIYNINKTIKRNVGKNNQSLSL